MSFFVGRERELDELQGGFESAFSGRGQLFLISGEPGIGKSRLADELAERARHRDADTLVGRCWEAGGAPPFWPWVQAIRARVREREPELLRDEVGAGAPDLAQIVPELREVFPGLPEPPSLESEAARFRLFDAASGFLRRTAYERPIVLVLDDLHAADEPSLLLLRFVARELATSRLLVLAVYRDVDPTVKGPLSVGLAELRREPVTRHIQLVGLAERDVRSFIELTRGVEPPTRLVGAIHRETEGNPLFVGEIVRLLVVDGHLDDSALHGLKMPPTVMDVIGRRLRRLSAACRELLTLASVLGREFDVDPLAQMSRSGRESTLALLTEATVERVISSVPRTPDRVRFAHALIRDALYDELSASRRMSLHGEVGRTLEQVYARDLEPHLAELAYHFLRAAGDDSGTALEYARRAADRAMAQLAYEEAVRLYRLALEALDLQRFGDMSVRCELLLSLGEAEEAAGEATESRETYVRAAEMARSVGNPEQLARAALGYGGRLTWLRPAAGDTRLVPLLEDALQALGNSDTTLRALLTARLASALRDDPSALARAKNLSREAVAIARRLGDPLTLFYVLIGHRMIVWAPENIHEHLEVASEIVDLADEAGDPERRADARLMRSDGYLIRGDIDGVRADLDAAVHLSAETHRATAAWHLLVHQSFLALLEGRFDEAEALIPEMARVGQQAKAPDAAVSAVTQTFALRWGLGGLRDIEAEVAKMALERPTRPFFRCLLAVADLELGRNERARTVLEELAPGDFAAIPPDKEWMLSMCLLVEVAAALGDVDQAVVLYRQLESHGDLVVVNAHEFSIGSAARTLGLASTALSRYDIAAQHFHDALALNEQLGARPWLARTQYDNARMLIARQKEGDAEAALELLESALVTCDELGMEPLATSARALLLRLGVRERAAGILDGHGIEFLGYRLEELVGRGGMSLVYRASDHRLKRFVALKLMAPELASDPGFRERFLSESELAASLEHPNVVPIYDAGEVEGQLFIVMRLVEGSDLKRLLRERGTLSAAQTIAVCQQLAEALDAAHASGLVHRDVKPSNVLLDEHEHVYLADFGLTRRLSEQAPGVDAGLSLGTPAYVAPEQIEGKGVGAGADQYSLACLMHECLTGEPPFPRSSEVATLFAHLEEAPPAPPGLEQVMAIALAKDPAQRYESCAAFITAARAALGLEPKRARWPLAVAGVGAVLIGVALLAFFFTREGAPTAPLTSGRVIRIDPATNEVAASISTGTRPSAVAVAGDDVWVVDRGDGTLVRVDARTNEVVQRASAHGQPADIAVGDGWALVTNGPEEANIAAFEATTGQLDQLKSLPPGSASPQLAAGEEGIWVAIADRRVSRIRFLTGERSPDTSIPPPRNEQADAAFSAIALGEGGVWVLGDLQDPRLWLLDPKNGKVEATIRLPFAPKDLAVGAGGIWITSQLDDTLARIDPKTKAIKARVSVGRGAAGVSVGAGAVWVANEIDETVSRVDPEHVRVVETIPVEGAPSEIAASADGVWVTSHAG